MKHAYLSMPVVATFLLVMGVGYIIGGVKSSLIVAVLEKSMRLSEDVIRYLTVKQEGPLPAPRVVANNESEPDKEKEKEHKSN